MADSSIVIKEQCGGLRATDSDDENVWRTPSNVNSKREEQVLDSVEKLARARNSFLEDYRSFSNASYNRESSESQCTQRESSLTISNPGDFLHGSQNGNLISSHDNSPEVSAGIGYNGDSSNAPEPSINWVNYQFNRLISGNMKLPKTSVNMQNTLNTDLRPAPPNSKSVEEIMREYGPEPLLGASFIADPDLPRACRMSNTKTMMNEIETKQMNLSQNNETLDALASDVDNLSVRRAGSSVDADGGDFMKSFNIKSSLSNIAMNRSRTSLSSHTHLPATEDKDLTESDRHGSEVDFKQALPAYRRESSDIRSDFPTLGFTFQKERERLLNIDTILRRTPFSSYSGASGSSYQPWKSQYRYTSSFMSSFGSELSSERRAFSSTDHKFSSLDRKPSSSEVDYGNVRHTTSNPSYRNLGHYSSTQSTSRPTGVGRSRDYGTGTYTSAKTFPTRKYSYKTETPSSATSFQHASKGRTTTPSTKTTTKTGIHRKIPNYNVSRNRNMSKALTENQEINQKNNTVTLKKHKSVSHIHDDGKENKGICNKYSDRAYVSKSSTHVGKDKATRQQSVLSKYQPYKPIVTSIQDKAQLQRAKSEMCNAGRVIHDNYEKETADESYLNMQNWSPTLKAVSNLLAKQGNPTNGAKSEAESNLSTTHHDDSLEGTKLKNRIKKSKGKNTKTFTIGLKGKKNNKKSHSKMNC